LAHKSSVNTALSVDFERLSLLKKAMLVLVGTMVLALSSQLSVPMVPVPITMQTFAVTMIGALYGWRLGTLTVLAWLGEAALGLPVLANGSSGLVAFAGPTAGYLAAFPLMAALVGYVSERFIGPDRLIGNAFLHFAANILCLILGTVWLTGLLDFDKAFAVGFAPFVLGAVLKSILAAACLAALGKRFKRQA
jgi:biotin transport system substrate-specific component